MYQITSCRQKGALMKFYDVALAQGVHDKIITWTTCRSIQERDLVGQGMLLELAIDFS